MPAHQDSTPAPDRGGLPRRIAQNPSIPIVSKYSPCPTPLYRLWLKYRLRTQCMRKTYELRGCDRGDMKAVEGNVVALPGARPTLAASARRLVQQPSTIFCIQLVSSLMKTGRLPSDLCVPKLTGSTAVPAEAEIGATSVCRTILVACISSNSMHWRTIW